MSGRPQLRSQQLKLWAALQRRSSDLLPLCVEAELATALTPNAGSYYVWLLEYRGVPLDTEGPYGPYDLKRAGEFARIGARNGDHDRAVSYGRDPNAESFSIARRYRRGTGERIL
jgi:hypothetical protein